MVEGIAARPVDEARIRIAVLAAIIVERRAWIEQHVGYSGDRYEASNGIATGREGRPRHMRAVAADAADGAARAVPPADQHGEHGAVRRGREEVPGREVRWAT